MGTAYSKFSNIYRIYLSSGPLKLLGKVSKILWNFMHIVYRNLRDFFSCYVFFHISLNEELKKIKLSPKLTPFRPNPKNKGDGIEEKFIMT